MRLIVLLVAAWIGTGAAAQDKALKIVLGYPPGASSDVLTRWLAEKMHASLGVRTIVENKTGAGGIVGTEAVKNAAPDGTTILLAPMVAFPHSHGSAIRYDPFKDFAPVAHLSNFQIALAVNAEVPAGTVADYVALVKKDPKAGDYDKWGPVIKASGFKPTQ